jgi:hypothetical protein
MQKKELNLAKSSVPALEKLYNKLELEKKAYGEMLHE